MENLLKLLPPKPQPAVIRFGATAAMVGVFALFHRATLSMTGPYGFVFFIPPVLLPSIMFDRGTGMVATAMSLLVIGVQLDWDGHVLLHATGLTLFALVAMLVVLVGEGMRKALERSAAARRELQVLLQEQTHRIRNDLAMASSLLALQARSVTQPAARELLDTAIARLHVVAESYDHLQVTSDNRLTNMQEYLGKVCWKLSEGLRGSRPIAVEVDAGTVALELQRATRVGLMVNELVTNALKHAFPDERAGVVSVRLRAEGAQLRLEVQDNGVGCPPRPAVGLGWTLVQLLTQQLRGTVERRTAEPGCLVQVAFPAARGAASDW